MTQEELDKISLWQEESRAAWKNNIQVGKSLVGSMNYADSCVRDRTTLEWKLREAFYRACFYDLANGSIVTNESGMIVRIR